MKGFDSLLSYRDAISSFSTEKWELPGTVKIPIDGALGKISSHNVLSVKNIPCHDKSAMDGYAVLSKDTINASSSNPARLILKGCLNRIFFPPGMDHLDTTVRFPSK